MGYFEKLDFECEECDKTYSIPQRQCVRINYKMLNRGDNFNGWRVTCPKCSSRLSTDQKVERSRDANPQRKATKRILGTDVKVIDHPYYYHTIPADLEDKLEEEKKIRQQKQDEVKEDK